MASLGRNLRRLQNPSNMPHFRATNLLFARWTFGLCSKHNSKDCDKTKSAFVNRHSQITRAMSMGPQVAERDLSSADSENEEKPRDLVQKTSLGLEKSLEKTSELLEYAFEGQGTVYFDKDMKDAEKFLNDSLLQYNNLMMNADHSLKKDFTHNFGRRIKELVAFKEMVQVQNMKHNH